MNCIVAFKHPRYFVLLFFLLVYNASFAQVKVKIVDAKNGAFLKNAIIQDSTGINFSPGDKNFFLLSGTGTYHVIAHGYEDYYFEVNNYRKNFQIALEPLKYTIEEVEIQGYSGKFEKAEKIPGAVSIRTGIGLDLNQSIDLSSIINTVPGVFMHSGTYGTNKIVMRGIGSRIPYNTSRVKAYLNNIPVTNGDGITILEDLEPAFINRVEVLSGPSASMYGASLGGVIKLFTGLQEPAPPAIILDHGAGSFGTIRNVVSFQQKKNTSGFHVGLHRTSSEGFRENNQLDRYGMIFNGNKRISDKSFLSPFLYVSHFYGEIPSSLDSLTFMINPENAAINWKTTNGHEEYDKWTAGLNYLLYLPFDLKLEMTLFGNSRNSDEIRPFNMLTENRKNLGSRIIISRNNEKSYSALGMEGSAERFNYQLHENIDGTGEWGKLTGDFTEKSNYLNFFIQHEYNLLNDLFLSGGMNMNFTRFDFKDLSNNIEDQSGLYKFDPVYSPRISARYEYLKNQNVYFLMSHGFSAPSLAETLTPEGLINPGIQPEKSWNYEMGFKGRVANDKSRYQLVMYQMNVTDLLVAERISEDAYVGRNAGSSRHRGFEISMDGHFLQSENTGEVSYLTSFNYNSFIFTDFTEKSITYNGNVIPGVPSHLFSAGIYYTHPLGLQGAVKWRNVGKMALNDENSVFTNPYHILDLKFGYNFELTRGILFNMEMDIKNLTNEHYASMIVVNAPSFGGSAPRYYYPGMPLNYYIHAKITYTLQ